MVRRMFLIGWVLLYLLTALASRGLAAEKLRFGSPSKKPTYSLVLLAAEEKGFWKQNGLDTKWIPFRGASDVHRAIAAGALDMAYDPMASLIQAASAGIPMVAVAETNRAEYYIWVKSDSLILKPAHLKGTTFGSSRLGGLFHAYGLVAVRGLGLEKDVKFISTGGHGAFLGAIKTGKIHSVMLNPMDAIPLMLKGLLRPLVSISQFLPKENIDDTIAAPRPFIDKNPGLVRRAVKSILQSKNFVLQNKPWAEKQLIKTLKHTPRVASIVSDLVIADLPVDPKITRKAVDNVKNFLIEYKLIDEKKAPPADELFT
ncbi:MAG: ABC transporter substrate-binding protein, partial [Thermodesulfobacteriota bacterium]